MPTVPNCDVFAAAHALVLVVPVAAGTYDSFPAASMAERPIV